MIDIFKIQSACLDENLKEFTDEIKINSSSDEFSHEANVYKQLMKYSFTLLSSYHEALKIELATQKINI